MRQKQQSSLRGTKIRLPRSLTFLALTLAAAWSSTASASCTPGIYGEPGKAFVVLGPPAPPPSSGQRYLFRDGRRGGTEDKNTLLKCDGDVADYAPPGGGTIRWTRARTIQTNATFESFANKLSGQLIEPPGPVDPTRPLVVMVHGSEKTAAIGNVYGYMLVAQGVSVFTYDKRGTGASEGDYTQNFELLADDAAAALAQARRMAGGRFGRAGFFGGSQGGWVAPLAASRSRADFVAVGFGLVVSPIEEDREQMLDEGRLLKLDAGALARIDQLSSATATIVRSHFTTGFEALERLRREVAGLPWSATLQGEYSGAMLRMSDADLRRVGRARFDGLGLIWDYDSYEPLKKLKTPLLWVLAGEDREAPIPETKSMLTRLIEEGQPIDLYLFPDTDHGMLEFRSNPDGSRTPTRITDGYLKLLADWMKGSVAGSYGRAVSLH